MSALSRYFPWAVVVLAAIYLLAVMLPPEESSKEMRLNDFGKIPVVEGGRVKPIDTVARNHLMLFSHRTSFTDANEKLQPAIKWLLDTMVSNEWFQKDLAKGDKVFRIENDQVLHLLGLKPREGLRYSIDELAPHIEAFLKQADQARNKDESKQDIFDVKVLELANHLRMYLALSSLQHLLMVPPTEPGGEWQSLVQAVVQAHDSKTDNPAARSLATLLSAYAKNDAKAFNTALDEYQQRLDAQLPGESRMAEFECFFNHFAPFFQSSVLYVLVIVLVIISWTGWTQPLNRAAFWLTLLILLMHSWALLARMVIQGRPPVTNLYSSAVFIGWGCVVLGLILEAIYKNGLGNLVAGILGFLTMLIAPYLSDGSDTMEMMRAVLDTNFWLATHVTCVTLGYTATFMAGALGTAFILRGVLTPSLDREKVKSYSQMIYGVLCFATLLSFTGTVLGGIWADQSWGRFWGWDPKENGAVLVVIWNVLILHARWAGLVKQRGMAVLTVVGNMVTAWSWFGTNQLGVGLHAYGFNKFLADGLVIFWATQLVVLGLGALPMKWWRSFAGQRGTPRPRKIKQDEPELVAAD
jgi:ABC-type transport system involved in cytochrome c biogenesis permease subunit